MSYQVLARKYRPQNFDEVVGQEHVTSTLKNAILKQRIHHGYLFTGVRGTGKTSLARIFAKSLNCETGPTVTPCGKCSHCLSITAGNSLDVIEIDGASNTSVENVRELREQVKYVPASSRYKIYIIDEIHMLSTSAFNALLKTLEEPPPHVLFFFATTEAHKIPVTILSRCQRFDLRRLSPEQIRQKLEKICREEGVKADAASLELLSRSAEGSLRDAQSLLDMAIGQGGEALQAEKIREMLGLTENIWIEEITEDCLQGRLEAALKKAQEIYERGYDLRQVTVQWVEYWHDLLLLKSAGSQALDPAYPADRLAVMEKSLKGIELEALQVAFQTVYRASEEIFRSESPKILFDILLVKLVHGAPYQGLAQVLGGTTGSRPLPSAKTQAPVSNASSPPAPAKPRSLPTVGTEELLQRALRKSPQIRALLDQSLSRHWEGTQYIVVFEKDSINREMFLEKKDQLQGLLSEELGMAVKIEMREGKPGKPETARQDPGPSLPLDPIVQQAVEILNATVQEMRKG